MSTVVTRRQFASDNNSGICPEALEAVRRFNAGHVVAYGSDEITAKAERCFRDLFEIDCVTFFVFNGTAANSLAIGSFCVRRTIASCAIVILTSNPMSAMHRDF